MEHSRRLAGRFCSLLALVIWLTPACASPPPPPKMETPPELASARGKYSGLRMVFDRPRDHERFGRYADVGHKPGDGWRGIRAPAGYWVYVHPTWYLWDAETTPMSAGAPALVPAAAPAQSLPPATAFQESPLPPPLRDGASVTESCQDDALPALGCSEDAGDNASACGRYAGLLRVIFRPQARHQFPEYHRLGWRDAGPWQGAKDVPGGFWVYVYPNWYVWEKEVAIPAMRAE
jgi:hypothetical protein